MLLKSLLVIIVLFFKMIHQNNIFFIFKNLFLMLIY